MSEQFNEPWTYRDGKIYDTNDALVAMLMSDGMSHSSALYRISKRQEQANGNRIEAMSAACTGIDTKDLPAGGFAALQAENERLTAIVERLPLTKDGVRVVPFIGNVWAIKTGQPECCGVSAFEDNRGWMARPYRWDIDWNMEVSECYSTLEAARQALEGGQSNG